MELKARYERMKERIKESPKDIETIHGTYTKNIENKLEHPENYGLDEIGRDKKFMEDHITKKITTRNELFAKELELIE